jgi:hypothetical protein
MTGLATLYRTLQISQGTDPIVVGTPQFIFWGQFGYRLADEQV